MSRHQMTVSSGTGSRLDEAGERGKEVAVAGAALVVCETEPVGGGPCPRAKVFVFSLREVEEATVVPEVLGEKLRMPVEPEATDDDRIEMSGEEVGEVEGRGLRVVQLLPFGVPREESVAVVAREPLDS